MNKKILAAFVLLFTASLFISCGKAKTDEFGCFQTLDQALKNAQKKDQEVLVIVTMQGDDELSQAFVSEILSSEEFKQEILPAYSVLLMDFSQASYQKTVVNETDSKADQKAAEEYAKIVQDNSKTASLLNVSKTPSLYLLTKENYFITEVAYTDEVRSFADLKKNLDDQAPLVSQIKELIAATKKGSNQEKMAAIDKLYENTEIIYRTFLSDLINKYVEMDKDNESGLLSKYLFAQADSKASNLYMSGDTLAAAKAYVEACSNPNLEADYKQQAYYMAAYIMSMSGSTDYATILDYLNLSIQANPESESVESINQVVDYLKSVMSQMEEGTGSLDSISSDETMGVE
ncbi:MAG: hypothetical protein K6C97_07635 [Treponema sp.]|nr:hypothetical protein [Treponema sp.]